MKDRTKRNRIISWVSFGILVITIPVFSLFDNRQISESELVTIGNLSLLKSPDYVGGKMPRIDISITNSERILVVNLEELECVTKKELLKELRKGDIISVKIFHSDTFNFYDPGFISRYQKIYGLKKESREYIELDCRNNVSSKKTGAAIWASVTSAVLSLFLALIVFRRGATRYVNVDPILVISLCWFLVAIINRL